MEMDFLNQVKNTLTSAGQDVANKAKETSETIKIKNKIRVKKSEINNELEGLGRAYFENHLENYDSEYEIYFNKIAELNADILECEKELIKMSGMLICPNCGEDVIEGNLFCGKCGAKI